MLKRNSTAASHFRYVITLIAFATGLPVLPGISDATCAQGTTPQAVQDLLHPTHAPVPTKISSIHLKCADADIVKKELTGEGVPTFNLTLPAKVIDNSIFGEIARQVAPGPLTLGTPTTNLLPEHYNDAYISGSNAFGEKTSQVNDLRYQIAHRQGGLIRTRFIEPNDITALSNSSTLIVRYRDDAEGEVEFRELQTRVRLLDIKPRKIQIVVRFVQATAIDVDQFGFNWQFQRVNLDGLASRYFPAEDQAILQSAFGPMQSQLNFILSTGRGKELASPEATTYNLLPVRLGTTADTYSFDPQKAVGGNGEPQTTYTPILEPRSSCLIVRPRIDSDNSVTLIMEMQLLEEYEDRPGERLLVQLNAPDTRKLRSSDSVVIRKLTRTHGQLAVVKASPPGNTLHNSSPYKETSVNSDDLELLIFITAALVPEPLQYAEPKDIKPK
jgi:hypothetical protein